MRHTLYHMPVMHSPGYSHCAHCARDAPSDLERPHSADAAHTVLHSQQERCGGGSAINMCAITPSTRVPRHGIPRSNGDADRPLRHCTFGCPIQPKIQPRIRTACIVRDTAADTAAIRIVRIAPCIARDTDLICRIAQDTGTCCILGSISSKYHGSRGNQLYSISEVGGSILRGRGCKDASISFLHQLWTCTVCALCCRDRSHLLCHILNHIHLYHEYAWSGLRTLALPVLQCTIALYS